MSNEWPPTVWEGTVLTVPNRHVESCGKPPNLKAEECYTAYFENGEGEQLVFQYDYRQKKATLWHGDYSWEHPVPVMGGGTTLTMSHEEREWLQLVWRVATRRESDEFQLRSALDLINEWKAVYDRLLADRAFAGDSDMQRRFRKEKRKLEKQEKTVTGQLMETQIKEALE